MLEQPLFITYLFTILYAFNVSWSLCKIKVYIPGFNRLHCYMCLTRGNCLLADQGAGKQIGEWLWWCAWTERWWSGRGGGTRGYSRQCDGSHSSPAWGEGASVRLLSSSHITITMYCGGVIYTVPHFLTSLNLSQCPLLLNVAVKPKC